MNLSHLSGAMNLLMDQLATISEIPSTATADTERSVIISNLACTRVLEKSAIHKQRAGMGSVYALSEVFTAVPSVDFDEDDRFILGSKDYRIRKVTPMPNTDPQVYHVLLEDES